MVSSKALGSVVDYCSQLKKLSKIFSLMEPDVWDRAAVERRNRDCKTDVPQPLSSCQELIESEKPAREHVASAYRGIDGEMQTWQPYAVVPLHGVLVL